MLAAAHNLSFWIVGLTQLVLPSQHTRPHSVWGRTQSSITCCADGFQCVRMSFTTLLAGVLTLSMAVRWMQVLMQKLDAVQQLNARMHVLPGHTNVGIVIEGGALNMALADKVQDSLMELCRECKAVVCCRVTPMQKAQVGCLLPVVCMRFGSNPSGTAWLPQPLVCSQWLLMRSGLVCSA